jgi:hypothetical protein
MTDEQEKAAWIYVDTEVTATHRAGRHTQDLCSFTEDFFARYSAADVPQVLRKWNLAERIRLSPERRVVVTAEGIK